MSNSCPRDSLDYIFDNAFIRTWPDIEKYKDKIYLVYAGLHIEYNFHNRKIKFFVDEIKDALASGKTKIIFAGEAEDFCLEVVDKIHRIIDRVENLKPEDCTYISSGENVNTLYNEYCKKQGYTNRINCLSLRHFESIFQRWAKSQKEIVELSEYKIYPREKTFLCFNKVHREHRIMLLDLIFKYDLLDKSFYSFQGEVVFGRPDITWIDTVDKKYKYFLKNKDKFPLVLNITKDRYNPTDITPDDHKYFRKSYFSVITETVYFENHKLDSSVFFSEKIWKPIVMNHPFILVARHKMLAKLKDLGYKTFHPFINESYDDIRDPKERMIAIVEEIKRLSELSEDDMLEWQKGIKPIVEYNRQTFFEKTKFSDVDSVDHLFRPSRLP